MTDKIKSKWHSLSFKYRILAIVAVSLALIAVPIMALAGSNISFSDTNPISGSVTGNPKPTISTKAVATDGSINQEDVSMSINGQSISPSFDPSTGIISHTPTTKMEDKNHSVVVGVYDSSTGKPTTNNWNFTIDAIPNPSKWYPGKNTKITTSSPTLSLYVKDNYDNLDTSTIVVKLDGQVITHKWNPVTYTYTLKEGTITAATNNLSDGLHNVEFKISDHNGNVLTESWSFTVAQPPQVSNLSPADKSQQTKVSQVSAAITDNTAIDWTSLTLSLNGTLVIPTFDKSTGIVTYNADLASNNYKAVLKVKDEAGNLATKTWEFIADSAPPSIDYLYDFTDGMEILDGKLKIRLGLKDLVSIKHDASLSLNGSPLDIIFRYKGYTDSYTGQWIVTSNKEAHIEYEGIVSNGSHTLVLNSEDALGNKLTKTWTFTVSAKPVISYKTPVKYGITDLTPEISAVLKSPNGTIDSSSIELKLNDVKVEHSYDSGTGKVTYIPPKAIADESYHTVSLVAYDTKGLSQTSSWKFYTTTYPEMPDSNISNCTSCHDLKPLENSNGPFEEIHAGKLWFGGGHNNNRCDSCHNYISEPAGCQQCHSDDTFNYAPHGSTPAIKYAATNYEQPLRVLENREMWDCIICHQPGAGTKGFVGAESTPSRLLNNHDIPELHKTTTVNYGDCNQCHAKSLTREHTRDGRVDAANKPISCKTCHESSDTKVKEAITNKKTDCLSCHTDANHNELHTYQKLNSGCMTSGCHSNELTTEHKNRGFTCQTCHEAISNTGYSADFKQGINLAITWNQLSCSECHSGQTKHGVAMAKTIPDALKYSPLNWMSPESLDFWSGESWVPSDMAGGLYTISKRNTTITKSEVLAYYETKMDELGWTKKSGPGTVDDKFELIYTKGTSKTIIRFYNTENYISSTNLNVGNRIEVLYK